MPHPESLLPLVVPQLMLELLRPGEVLHWPRRLIVAAAVIALAVAECVARLLDRLERVRLVYFRSDITRCKSAMPHLTLLAVRRLG